MTEPFTLIHLVSDQTMQNILPILAFSPGRVVQVSSENQPRFFKPATNTCKAVIQASLKNGFANPSDWQAPVAVGVESPSIEETRGLVAGLLSRYPNAIVNYTGGTKNMSLGAWLAARDAGVPTIYCDTPRRFLDGGTGAWPVSPRSLAEVAKGLNVPVLLASQGLLEGREWGRQTIDPSEKELGIVSYRLSQDHGRSFRSYRQQLQMHGFSKDGRVRAEELNRAWSNPVPEPPDAAFIAYLEAANAAGLLVKEDGGRFFYNLRRGDSSQQWKRQIERIAQGLTGAAFEAYVAALLERSSRFTDFLANVYPLGSEPEHHGFGESDFLVYEPGEVALTLISCKSSPPKLEHLESLLARKAKFGGLFARTLLCVEHEVQADRTERLRSYCRSLGIGCAIGDEIGGALGVETAAAAPGE